MADAYNGEGITVSTVAIGPTTALLESDVFIAFGTVENADIRFRYDGTNPTSTVGHLVVSGSSFRVEGAGNIRSLKLIRDVGAGADASVFVTYER